THAVTGEEDLALHALAQRAAVRCPVAPRVQHFSIYRKRGAGSHPGRGGHDERLKICPALAARLETRLLEPLGDPLGREVATRTARATPVHPGAGQCFHGGPEVGFGRRREGSEGGRRRRGDDDEDKDGEQATEANHPPILLECGGSRSVTLAL